MNDYIQLINNFISNNQVWAGPIIGLLCFGESLLVIGIMIPATAILIFTGGLIGTGTLDPTGVLIWGFIGAVLGDAVSYYIGRWFGWEITKKPPFNQYYLFFVKAHKFFEKYGTLSVFLGRFMGPIRSTIPTVAGVMELKHSKFQLANITSAIIWLPVMLSPGYFSAKGAQTLSAKTGVGIGEILTILSVVLGFGIVIYFFISSRKSKTNSDTLMSDKTDQS
ncbi:DedA family protein [Pelistega sp. NLN82]|uniref:DedA family protein n=1 Tax=Pelistega ratti TaxID=2652177 RepID=A0A6L9Y7M2_9BURK|nr:DedA family protein [Pelistega ratti]NEN76376.1 DedA family protein [Pelistega ratti]